MNIFTTDPCPLQSADNLDDKRVIKMILESTQLLSTAINKLGGEGPYKSTHVNHPCSIWVRTSSKNWLWLFDHAARLCTIYRHTYNKVHKCQELLNKMANIVDFTKFPDKVLTSHPNCTTFKEEQDIHKAYKLYLNDKWDNDKREPTWQRRLMPKWREKSI